MAANHIIEKRRTRQLNNIEEKLDMVLTQQDSILKLLKPKRKSKAKSKQIISDELIAETQDKTLVMEAQA